MKAFFALLKVSMIRTVLTAFSFGSTKKKSATSVLAFVLMSSLMVFISVSYALPMAYAFRQEGVSLSLMLGSMFLLALLMAFMFTVYSAQGTLFYTRDIDMVLSWPLSPLAVFSARVSALFLENALLLLLLLLPAGIIYIVFEAASILTLIPLVLVCLFAAMLSCTLSVFLSGLASLLFSRFRFKNLLIILFSFAMVLGILLVSMKMTDSQPSNLEMKNLSIWLRQSIPPLAWAMDAITSFDLIALVKTALLGLVPFLMVSGFLSIFYKRILTNLSSQHHKSNYKMKEVAASGVFGALLKKEARRFFGTPVLVLNSGIGIVMSVGGCIYLLVIKMMGNLQLESLALAMGNQIEILLVLALCLMASMVYTAAVSFSLEGECLWILKTAPVPATRIFLAKAGFNFILDAIMVVVAVPVLAYVFGLGLGKMILMLLLGLSASVTMPLMGVYINLMLPKMDGENDTAVVKRSASVLVFMAAGGLLTGAVFLLYLGISALGVGSAVALFCCTLMLAALAGLAWALLTHHGIKLYEKL